MPFDFGKFDIVEEAWPAGEIDRAHALAASGEGWLEQHEPSEGKVER
jgi:hypothetical protein